MKKIHGILVFYKKDLKCVPINLFQYNSRYEWYLSSNKDKNTFSGIIITSECIYVVKKNLHIGVYNFINTGDERQEEMEPINALIELTHNMRISLNREDWLMVWGGLGANPDSDWTKALQEADIQDTIKKEAEKEYKKKGERTVMLNRMGLKKIKIHKNTLKFREGSGYFASVHGVELTITKNLVEAIISRPDDKVLTVRLDYPGMGMNWYDLNYSIEYLRMQNVYITVPNTMTHEIIENINSCKDIQTSKSGNTHMRLDLISLRG